MEKEENNKEIAKQLEDLSNKVGKHINRLESNDIKEKKDKEKILIGVFIIGAFAVIFMTIMLLISSK